MENIMEKMDNAIIDLHRRIELLRVAVFAGEITPNEFMLAFRMVVGLAYLDIQPDLVTDICKVPSVPVHDVYDDIAVMYGQLDPIWSDFNHCRLDHATYLAKLNGHINQLIDNHGLVVMERLWAKQAEQLQAEQDRAEQDRADIAACEITDY
jgi:hypothetical protein